MKCQLSFFEVVLFEILNGADFSTDQAKNQRSRTKSKKKPPQDGAIEQTVYGFNSVVMELLTHLEAVSLIRFAILITANFFKVFTEVQMNLHKK